VPSRDGKKIFALGSKPRAELVRYDLKSGAFVTFLPGLSAGDVETSHDHKSLVYVKYPEGSLWRSNVDGTNRVQLANLPLQAAVAHWSPDDKRIAFSGSRLGFPTNIYLIPSDGGAPEKITSGPDTDLDPSWSPDGNTLAFGQLIRGGKSSSYSIKLLNMKSRQLSDLAAPPGFCCPRWSPDGLYLMALNVDSTQLMLFSFSAQKWSVLAQEVGEIGYMTWTPDSKSVVFDTAFVKEPFFYKVRIADSHLEPIVSLKDIRRYWGEWGPWTGLAPDGSPLLVRDVSNQEIYSLDLQLP
jgi:Tol biopolymer transport system component